MKTHKFPLLLLAPALAMVGSAHADVVVTDNGSTAPTLGANDTGNTTNATNRFSWDSDATNGNEAFTQTFTVANAGFIDAIYIGYNAFLDGNSITLDLSVNGSSVATGISLNGDNFSGSTGDEKASPIYWMKFDLSAENVAVSTGAAANSFTMTATAEGTGGGNAFPLAVMFNDGSAAGATSNFYTGGAASSSQINFVPSQDDLVFAVTVTPATSDPEITSISIADDSATVVMTGAAGTDYYCAGSADLVDWTTEITPTDTPDSPFQTDANGDLTFTVDISSLGSAYFFRVQDTDPSP